MSKIYSVTFGLQGLYLPDDIAFFATLTEARRDAMTMKRDCLDNGQTVRGNIRTDWCYEVGDHDVITISELDSADVASDNGLDPNDPDLIDTLNERIW